MSAMYCKIQPEYTPALTYGFRRVQDEELQEILGRICKPTYNSSLVSQTIVNNFPQFPGTRTQILSSCHRSQSRQTVPKITNQTAKDVERITCRLQRPTISYEMSKRQDVNQDNTMLPRPMTALPKRSQIRRLRRPTTASDAKSMMVPRYSSDREKAHANRILHKKVIVDPPVSAEEMTQILDRVSTPTFSSHGGSCLRSAVATDEVYNTMQCKTIPLISGLPRSRNVKEIVTRLHPHRQSTTATAVAY